MAQTQLLQPIEEVDNGLPVPAASQQEIDVSWAEHMGTQVAWMYKKSLRRNRAEPRATRSKLAYADELLHVCNLRVPETQEQLHHSKQHQAFEFYKQLRAPPMHREIDMVRLPGVYL